MRFLAASAPARSQLLLLMTIGSLKIHARPCYFRLAEEAVRQDQIVMRPRICADDLTGVAVVTGAAYHLVRQNVFCERNLGCSEVERAPACSAIIGILDRFTESVLTIGNSIDVVILGYLRWDQEPGDFPYRSSIWKYWNRPKIKSQNGASEKLTHITQNHFQNMCLCVRLSNHFYHYSGNYEITGRIVIVLKSKTSSALRKEISVLLKIAFEHASV
ncbi:unnamed protein product, partial [Nesidiocoris tenuis]